VSNSQSPGRGTVADTVPRLRSSGARRFVVACLLFIFLGFLALGTWQIQRLFWKLDLIARVDQRVHADPVAAPGPSAWSQVRAASHEYLHVRVTGVYLYAQTVRVQAATVLGSGFWLLTPLRSEDGHFYLINRGYVTGAMPDVQAQAAVAGQPVSVVGLLRISEPGGGFLRHNDAAAERWFSRDVEAIAAAHKLDPSRVAPYFIDAQANSGVVSGNQGQESQMLADGVPVPGLTVITFHNSHLVYAFTWYALALMMAGACFWVVRDDRRSRLRRSPLVADSFDQDTEDGKQG
jgi:surfeit locus 1 family protein